MDQENTNSESQKYQGTKPKKSNDNVVIIWIIIQAVTLYFNRKRRKALYKIMDDLKRIEGKIDSLSKKKK